MLFVPNRPEIGSFKILIVFVGKFFIILSILRKFCHFQGLVCRLQLKFIFARKLNYTAALLIINYNEYALITQATQLNGLFEKTPLSLAKGHISLELVIQKA